MLGLVEDWLTSKGKRTEVDGATQIALHDGRVGVIRTTNFSNEELEALTWTLEEPTDNGVFRTSLSLGRDARVIAVACELEAGALATHLAPVFFDARCPKIIRDIIGLDAPWSVGGTRVFATPMRFDGADGEDHLGRLIQSKERSLPLVVVSENQGSALHPGIADALARDLAGVAIVAAPTTNASWHLTNTLGVEWSCYNGAIRLYWPFSAVGEDPFKHPLWTPMRLLHSVGNTEDAARRIRTQLRRKILGLSTLTLRRHPLFDAAERAERLQLLQQRRAEATSDKELLDLFVQDNERLDAENQDLKNIVARLEADLANTRAMIEWAKHESSDEIPPDQDVPPASVADVIEEARANLGDFLAFGDDVSAGIERIAYDAGPPDKILDYLRGLSDLCSALRQGTLGTTMVKWLEQRGFRVSGESETIKNSKAEMKQRTWHDGSRRREFELHMKPSDATSPDRCVRIYFDWDQTLRKIVVGWVGRKPGF